MTIKEEQNTLRSERMDQLVKMLAGDDVQIKHFEIEDHIDADISGDHKYHGGKITLWYNSNKDKNYGTPVEGTPVDD